MKYTTALVGILLSGSALAAELPLNAVYGTPIACQLYNAGGTDAVEMGETSDYYHDGNVTIRGISAATAWDIVELVTPAGIFGIEDFCTFDSDSLGDIALTCEEAGSPKRSISANFTLTGDVLIWTDENGSLELRRCPD